MLKKASEKFWKLISIFSLIYLEKMYCVFFEMPAFDVKLSIYVFD